MANKHRGEVDIVLDKPRKVFFDLDALAQLESKLGYPFTKIGQDNMGAVVIRALLWAGLLHEIPDLTLEEASKLVKHKKFLYISEKVMEAFAIALEDEDINESEKN